MEEVESRVNFPRGGANTNGVKKEVLPMSNNDNRIDQAVEPNGIGWGELWSTLGMAPFLALFEALLYGGITFPWSKKIEIPGITILGPYTDSPTALLYLFIVVALIIIVTLLYFFIVAMLVERILSRFVATAVFVGVLLFYASKVTTAAVVTLFDSGGDTSVVIFWTNFATYVVYVVVVVSLFVRQFKWW